MRFDGPAPRTITTSRHSVAGSQLTVTDKGFDNVLAGFALNFAAMARLGDQTIVIPLDGAGTQVERFLNCLKASSV